MIRRESKLCLDLGSCSIATVTHSFLFSCCRKMSPPSQNHLTMFFVFLYAAKFGTYPF